MNIKTFVFVCIVILLALSIMCVFCPVISYADVPVDEFPTYAPVFQAPSGSLYNSTNTNSTARLAWKAYRIGLTGGAFPVAVCLEGRGNYYAIVLYCVVPNGPTYDPDLNKPGFNSIEPYYNNGNSIRVTLTDGTLTYLSKFVLCQNGTWYNEGRMINGSVGWGVLSFYSVSAGRMVPVNWDSTFPSSYYPSAGTTTIDIAQIEGAYDRIIAGYTVGGDGYDDGYTAGYDVGYSEGYGQGRTEGFTAGYDVGHEEGYETGYYDGYETGYDDGYETGYNDGFANGVDTGKGIGYTEGYDDGYETGYWEGWDDGYDDGYERGEFDASPIVIDVPSVITSVPQSAKAIINNAFGFELFGINIAGLLSVLLIVAIIGFVVRWLMSR